MEDVIKTVRITKVPFARLLSDEQELLKKALEARKNAQAPYSNYYVGVAILSEQNTIHIGCNVERCSYTQTTHAEQNAIDSMVAAIGPAKVTKVAIVAAPGDTDISLNSDNTSTKISAMPCGHCLQIIWENCHQDSNVKILTLESNMIVACSTIADLLPFRFGPECLNIFYKTNEPRSQA